LLKDQQPRQKFPAFCGKKGFCSYGGFSISQVYDSHFPGVWLANPSIDHYITQSVFSFINKSTFFEKGYHHETDLSATQHSPQAQAWFPGQDGDSAWA
jgi:hypothetical protein